ncbi:MAG: pyridoxal 5'-phosphate synthase glutaminase subunit PdxT [archaeon]|nr:pyridoxal 5'-phosphate synthase glutaminase subunit PdxT [archaeon]MCP8306470.1 pyridoxal 5'-phosphate synthase glutaminase subunit PdxT [archaeon]
MLRIGVLALQGDVSEHIDITDMAIREMGLEGEVVTVKREDQIDKVHGLIIPGGESTTIGRIAERYGLLSKIRDASSAGMPIFGTCAGLILMAKHVRDARTGKIDQPILGILDVEVVRNAFGRQRESFESYLEMPKIGKGRFPGVFIRAPAVSSVLSDEVEVLAIYEDKIAAVRQDNRIGIAFHPELTTDTRFHEFFIELILKSPFIERDSSKLEEENVHGRE